MATTTSNTFGFYGSEQQFLASMTIVASAYKATTAVPNSNIVFDKFAGGDVSAPVNKHRPGGMGPEVTYLSLPTYSDITLTKAYNTQVDNATIADLHNMCGNTQVTVIIQPLDDGGNTYGAPRQYAGRLIGIKDGGTDSQSNAVRMWEVTVAVESIAEGTAAASPVSASSVANASLGFGSATLGTF